MLSLFLLSINIFFGFFIIPLTHVLFKGLEHITADTGFGNIVRDWETSGMPCNLFFKHALSAILYNAQTQ